MTQNPSISFCLHFCWSPLLADLSIPNKISKYTCKKFICKMNGNLESPIGIPKWSSLYLKEWLKFYRLVHIRIGLIQKFANLFFRQNLMDAPEFLHHWRQIFYCYMICIWFLCIDKLLRQQIRSVNMITSTYHQILDMKLNWLVAYFCFEGSELNLGELALQPRIGDKNTNKGRHYVQNQLSFSCEFLFYTNTSNP